MGYAGLRAVRNKMARWLLNFEDFFLSFGRLIESSEERLISASYDTSEFLVCRLEEYARANTVNFDGPFL